MKYILITLTSLPTMLYLNKDIFKPKIKNYIFNNSY